MNRSATRAKNEVWLQGSERADNFPRAAEAIAWSFQVHGSCVRFEVSPRAARHSQPLGISIVANWPSQVNAGNGVNACNRIAAIRMTVT
jgi:hypothetical protein